MSLLDSDLNEFLQKYVHPRALESAQTTCVDEEIYTLKILLGLFNQNKLEDLFKRGTVFSISKGFKNIFKAPGISNGRAG